MSFEADLKSHLQADEGIAAIVGERIFPLLIPKGQAEPAITYTVVFGQPQNSVDGFTSGLTRYSIQLDCWALSFATLVRSGGLAQLVRDRMGVAAVTFHAIVNDYPILDDYEPDTGRYRRAIGVSCWHEEP